MARSSPSQFSRKTHSPCLPTRTTILITTGHVASKQQGPVSARPSLPKTRPATSTSRPLPGCHHTAAAAMDDYADFLFPKNSTKTLQGSSALLTTLVSCTALLYLKHVWTLTMQVCLFHYLCALVGERMYKGKGWMLLYDVVVMPLVGCVFQVHLSSTPSLPPSFTFPGRSRHPIRQPH